MSGDDEGTHIERRSAELKDRFAVKLEEQSVRCGEPGGERWTGGGWRMGGKARELDWGTGFGNWIWELNLAFGQEICIQTRHLQPQGVRQASNIGSQGRKGI